VDTAYASYTINAPVDSRLPDGGGYPILVYTPIVTGAAQNFLTRESRYGDDGEERESRYDGVNFNVNARMGNGIFASVGTTTGRRKDNTCNVVENYNNVAFGVAAGPNPRGCNSAEPWQTTLRGLASYTIPKVDVLVSASFRSQPPLQLTAGWPVPNTVIRNILGFLPPGTVATGNTTIQLTDNENRLYVDNRRTQIDMRFAKIFRFGRTRTDVGVDLSNLLNTNYATAYQTTYSYTQPNGGTWGNPTNIYSPRFVRLNFTVNY